MAMPTVKAVINTEAVLDYRPADSSLVVHARLPMAQRCGEPLVSTTFVSATSLSTTFVTTTSVSTTPVRVAP
jgi:hypothetical protein